MDEFLQHSESKFKEELSKLRDMQKNISVMDDQCMDPELYEKIAVEELPENEPTDEPIDDEAIDASLNEEIDVDDNEQSNFYKQPLAKNNPNS